MCCINLADSCAGNTFSSEYHFTHDFSHNGLCLVGCFLYFFMAYLYRCIKTAKVSHNADAKDADAAMVGNDDFRNSRHANRIATKQAVHLIFSRCFERWPLYADIDAVLQADVFLFGNFKGQLDVLAVVGLVHVREARSGREVLSAERVLREEIDVVGNHHQVADFELRIHAPCGVADEERLDAQFVHDSYGECDFLHGVSFIEMEASFHSHDVNTAKFSENELAGVAFDGRNGEIRYF